MLACKGISATRIIAEGNYIAVCRVLRNKNGCVFCSFMNEPFEYRSSGVF